MLILIECLLRSPCPTSAAHDDGKPRAGTQILARLVAGKDDKTLCTCKTPQSTHQYSMPNVIVQETKPREVWTRQTTKLVSFVLFIPIRVAKNNYLQQAIGNPGATYNTVIKAFQLLAFIIVYRYPTPPATELTSSCDRDTLRVPIALQSSLITSFTNLPSHARTGK